MIFQQPLKRVINTLLEVKKMVDKMWITCEVIPNRIFLDKKFINSIPRP